MKNLNQKTLAVTTAAILGLGVAGTAHAGAKAFMNLIIDDFVINKSGGAQYVVSDFDSLSLIDTLNNSSNFDGADPDSIQESDATSGIRTATLTNPLQNTANAPLSCVDDGSGDCAGIVENDFTQQPQLQQFARADSLLQGSIIGGFSGGVTPEATASQVSEVQINTLNGSGSSDSSVSNSTEFSFSLDNDDTMTFAFNASSAYHLLMNQPDFGAQVNRAFTITISDTGTGLPVFSFNPGVLNFARTIQDIDDISDTISSQPFTVTTPTLLAGTTYDLSIAGSTGVGAVVTQAAVPEPATLALLSAGLLGMGAASRRRRKV